MSSSSLREGLLGASSSSVTARSSFQDYHLVVDDEEEPQPRPQPFTTNPTTTLTPSIRRHDAQPPHTTDVYFDEDTTLPSRDDNDDPFASPLRRRSLSVQSTTRAPLGRKNYVNLLTYALHLFVSWGIGIWGLNGTLETRWQITKRYETLVTPAPWAYHLWFPILALEAVLVVAQLTPYYRNRPVVQDGIGYWFFATFCWQTAWTLLFSFQYFVASLVSVVLALVCLISLLLSQLHAQTTGRKKYWEYVLFCLPFYLHTGWMVLMVLDHLALVFSAWGTSASIQVAMDMVALALMLAVGVACLIRPPYQDFVIPAVLIWSLLGIAARLRHPSHAMELAYGLLMIQAVQYATQFLAAILLACLLPCVVVWLSRELCVIHVVELDE